ncbi:Crp/Fnr family transcriptional regulator [Frigoriflavimonas asaccharolytica]|uniref:CRP-like cAMP-binding protein n=1 Tax=Frigoriflavimonas asaccharolytica TaxID=2735899 RepID=A0A8J8G8Y8_9FLAO|nr:Crp/Fnr family transcriptional regulator [Frigoriflavimonas asaccharolytica]NRS91679.1 CRP-like cAMP-binding protein [Frigoriflavimonas asaccharolytica]
MSIDKIFKKVAIELPQSDKNLIQKYFTFSKYRRNDILINDKEDCSKMYFIYKGALRIFYFTINGLECTRKFGLEGEFCTNLISFTRQNKNVENIECLEDCLLYYITRENFYLILSQSPNLTHLYSKILEKTVKFNIDRFQFMTTLNEKQRVIKCLQEFSEINRRVKDKTIATYLNVTPQYFSKIKAEYFKNKKTSP